MLGGGGCMEECECVWVGVNYGRLCKVGTRGGSWGGGGGKATTS